MSRAQLNNGIVEHRTLISFSQKKSSFNTRFFENGLIRASWGNLRTLNLLNRCFAQPVACLSAYLDRTKDWRKGATDNQQQRLFLSFKKPYKPVTSATLSRWLKAVICQSGIKDIFGGHSVQSASTSMAKQAGVSIDMILNMADWTSQSTFNRFYYKPTLPVAYGTSVLSPTVETKNYTDGYR